MRKEFGAFISELAEIDDKVILIVGDIGYGAFDEFRERFPDRFFNFGICEQSIISASAGMALIGLKPYVFTITPFFTERSFEQIKVDINLNKANVKIVGYDDYPALGPTHNCIDNASYMKLFKNIKSYYPTTLNELESSLKESYELECPTFIRMKEPIK